MSDVFEYKTDLASEIKIEPPAAISNTDARDEKKSSEVEIPEDEEVVSEELLSFYLGHNVGEQISFRYQTSRLNSGKKWRNLKLIRYTEEYFWCRDLATDKVSMYRRDRVIDIRI